MARIDLSFSGGVEPFGCSEEGAESLQFPFGSCRRAFDEWSKIDAATANVVGSPG
jgi:hypothetical protein